MTSPENNKKDAPRESRFVNRTIADDEERSEISRVMWVIVAIMVACLALLIIF